MNARHVTFDLNKSPASPAPAAPSAPSADMARAYLLAMRQAGKRVNDNGIMAPAGRDATEADQKAAIQALLGAPVVGPLGSAIDNANRAAQRALRAPMPKSEALAAEPYRHGAKAAPSVAGYVAGMPSTETTKAALEAQERLLAEEIAAAVNANQDTAALDCKLSALRRLIASC